MRYRTLNPIFSINTTNNKRYFSISRKEKNILTVAQATNLVDTQFNGQPDGQYNLGVDLKLRKLR